MILINPLRDRCLNIAEYFGNRRRPPIRIRTNSSSVCDMRQVKNSARYKSFFISINVVTCDKIKKMVQEYRSRPTGHLEKSSRWLLLFFNLTIREVLRKD